MISDPRGERILDWAVTAAALVFALLQLWMQAQAGDTGRRSSIGDLRQLEDAAKVLDASLAYPDDVQRAIGLPASQQASVLAMLADVREQVSGRPWAIEERLVTAAIGAAYGVDAHAAVELDALAADPDALAAWRVVLESLLALSDGRPAPRLDAAIAALSAAGASDWLGHRLRARAARNANDPVAAARFEAAAVAHAQRRVAVEAIIAITMYGLMLAGLLVVLAWPWLMRWLPTRGYLGLGPGPPPFEAARVQRVVAGWFLGYLATGWLIGTLVHAVDGGTRVAALASAAQPVFHGAIAVLLIQRFGRLPGDERPLGWHLNLHLGAMQRPAAGLLLMVAIGLPLTVFAATGGAQLNQLLFGAPQGQQQALALVSRDGSAATLTILLVGAAIFAPIVEEVLFRGFLYRVLRNRMGRRAAALASGLVFAAAHLRPDLLLPLTALGAALAYCYELGASLWVPIIVHGCWNLLNLLGVYAIYQAA